MHFRVGLWRHIYILQDIDSAVSGCSIKAIQCTCSHRVLCVSSQLTREREGNKNSFLFELALSHVSDPILVIVRKFKSLCLLPDCMYEYASLCTRGLCAISLVLSCEAGWQVAEVWKSIKSGNRRGLLFRGKKHILTLSLVAMERTVRKLP